MIKFMQQYAKFFYFFFFLIIISFIFFYIGPADENNRVPLIEIGERKTYSDQYWRVYENMKNYYVEMYKENFNEAKEKELNLKKLALDAIVEDELLAEAATRLKLSITDEELSDSITTDPNFLRDGVFKQDIYLKTLELNRLTPAYYESKKREDLLVLKIKRLIELSISQKPDLPPDVAEKFKGQEQILDAIRKSSLNQKKFNIIKSYVEGLKKTIPVKVREDQIS